MRFSSSVRLLVLLLACCGLACQSGPDSDEPRVLVFTKTEGYRPGSTEAGLAALDSLGMEHGWHVEKSDDASVFTEEELGRYRAVVFLNTTGDVLDPYQQNAFQRFIEAGGGFVGVNTAASTERTWPWFGRLVGAGVADDQDADGLTVRRGEVRRAGLNGDDGASWMLTDRWPVYTPLEDDVEVLLTSADGAPVAWRHETDGGRAFYTAGGGTPQTFADAHFLEHLREGLAWAIGDAPIDYARAATSRMPEADRFSRTILADYLDEPTELEILPGERIVFLERKGAMKLYDPEADSVRVISRFDVDTSEENGLLGIALDPNFETNNWIYVFYSAPEKPVNRLSRFEFVDEAVDFESEVMMLEVETQREECCHTGGSVEFGPDGNLFVSTGDNTNPFQSDGFGPIDERPGRAPFDGQGGPANTNDLRGKILRITPQPDGSYTIPEGNLFPPGTEQTRPEIYVMGNRNPYRISIDPKTGFLYWGEVGPDADDNDPLRGPRGHDEVNQARQAGFFGWPYFVADNKAYGDHNFATGETGPRFDPAAPINDSPNNTGLRELPPAQPAFIWYPYAVSPEFPIVGAGGRNAMAGPVFHSDLYGGSPNAFPAYYDGKLFIYDWIRGWVLVATMDEEGDLLSLEPFMPDVEFSNPMDMAFADSGVLYMLEYGKGWFQQNPDARLSRITYHGGNRAPVARIAPDRTVGPAPLTVELSGATSFDADGEDLTYRWMRGDNSGTVVEGPTATFTYDTPGIYRPRLTVSDGQGQSDTADLEIRVGNDEPQLAFELEGNKSFYWGGRSIKYAANLNDAEDGSLADGTIDPSALRVYFDYLDEGYDLTLIEQGHRTAEDAAAAESRGARLIAGSDCRACHALDRPSIGPSYLDVARRYRGDEDAPAYLANKIISGGGGVWGEQAMAAHPQLSMDEATAIANHILSLGQEETGDAYGPEGTLTAEASDSAGVYLLKGVYTDRGAAGAPPISVQEVLVLRHPRVQAESYDHARNVGQRVREDEPVWITDLFDGSYVAFDDLDLTGVDAISFRVRTMPGQAGGRIEVRLDAPDGQLVGTAEVPAEGGDAPREVRAELETLASSHDLFLVFTNSEAQGSDLFMVDWLYVHPEELPG